MTQCIETTHWKNQRRRGIVFFVFFYYFPCPTHPARCAPCSVQGRLYTVSPSSTAFFNCSIEEAIGANIRLTTSSRGTHGEPGTTATLGNDA